MTIQTLPASFSCNTTHHTDVGDVDIPLLPADRAYIRDELGDDGHTYLVLSSPTTLEVVKAYASDGQLAWERGQDGTSVVAHPRGTCLKSTVTAALVKDLICGYDCCAGDCPCTPVAVEGVTVGHATVGRWWQAVAVFSGSVPMTVGTSGVPAWMTVVVGPNYAIFSGTPSVAGSYALAASATNCNGQIATAVLPFEVTAP